MRKHSVALLVCATFSLGAASWALSPKPQTLHYEVRLKSLNFGNMGTRKMYIKGSNMRWEGKAEHIPLVVVRNSKGTFLIHPFQKVAAKYPSDSNRSNPRAYFPGPTGLPSEFLARVKAVKQGTEKVERETCDVYSYSEPFSDRRCKLWISNKSGKPVKLVMQGVKKKADTIVATYTKFALGGSLSDSLFQLPKGYAERPMPKPKLTSEKQTPKPEKRERA